MAISPEPVAPEPADASYHHPRTVEELTRSNVDAIIALQKAALLGRSRTDRVVDAITGFCGHIGFVYLHVLFFGAWIGINTLLSKALHFDPYPFEFLTLFVSLEAIFLSAVILISQNRAGQQAERRNELALQIALLSEQENTKILQLLDAIARKVDADLGGDPDIAVLESATRPDKLIEQIEASHQQNKC